MESQGPRHVPVWIYLVGFVVLGSALSLAGPALSHLRDRVGTDDGGISLVFVGSSSGYMFGSFIGGRFAYADDEALYMEPGVGRIKATDLQGRDRRGRAPRGIDCRLARVRARLAGRAGQSPALFLTTRARPYDVVTFGERFRRSSPGGLARSALQTYVFV